MGKESHIFDSTEAAEVRRLMDRIKAVLIKRNRGAYEGFLSACRTEPELRHYIRLIIEDFEVQLHNDNWFIIYDGRPGAYPFRVLDARIALGRVNFTWTADVVRKFVVPVIDRELILEDMARI